MLIPLALGGSGIAEISFQELLSSRIESQSLKALFPLKKNQCTP